MLDKTVEQIVLETISELKRNGTIHSDCPWSGVDADKIHIVKQMPSGAFRMVMATWNVFNRFGQSCGNAIAVGAFIVILALLCIGGLFLFKLGELVLNLWK